MSGANCERKKKYRQITVAERIALEMFFKRFYYDLDDFYKDFGDLNAFYNDLCDF